MSGHWFCEADQHDAFNRAAARLAWERTVEIAEWLMSETRQMSSICNPSTIAV